MRFLLIRLYPLVKPALLLPVPALMSQKLLAVENFQERELPLYKQARDYPSILPHMAKSHATHEGSGIYLIFYRVCT